MATATLGDALIEGGAARIPVETTGSISVLDASCVQLSTAGDAEALESIEVAVLYVSDNDFVITLNLIAEITIDVSIVISGYVYDGETEDTITSNPLAISLDGTVSIVTPEIIDYDIPANYTPGEIFDVKLAYNVPVTGLNLNSVQDAFILEGAANVMGIPTPYRWTGAEPSDLRTFLQSIAPADLTGTDWQQQENPPTSGDPNFDENDFDENRTWHGAENEGQYFLIRWNKVDAGAEGIFNMTSRPGYLRGPDIDKPEVVTSVVLTADYPNNRIVATFASSELVERWEYQIKVDDGEFGAWMDTETLRTSFYITSGVTLGKRYTVRVRGVRGTSDGTASADSNSLLYQVPIQGVVSAYSVKLVQGTTQTVQIYMSATGTPTLKWENNTPAFISNAVLSTDGTISVSTPADASAGTNTYEFTLTVGNYSVNGSIAVTVVASAPPVWDTNQVVSVTLLRRRPDLRDQSRSLLVNSDLPVMFSTGNVPAWLTVTITGTTIRFQVSTSAPEADVMITVNAINAAGSTPISIRVRVF